MAQEFPLKNTCPVNYAAYAAKAWLSMPDNLIRTKKQTSGFGKMGFCLFFVFL